MPGEYLLGEHVSTVAGARGPDPFPGHLGHTEGVSFSDRADAGRRLGQRLQSALGHERDVLVVGLPRGGVPVAYEVAEAVSAPLDILLVHKLGVPFQPELAMGAIGDTGHVVIDEHTVHWAGVTPDQLADAERRELERLRARGEALRRGRPPTDLRGRTVVLVDDGAATGLTALAACHLAREAGARRIIVGLPVASREAVSALKAAADDVVVLEVPRSFGAVGAWYGDFGQTSEDEVVALLERAREHQESRDSGDSGDPRGHDPGAGRAHGGSPAQRAAVELRIPCDDVVLEGTLVPPAPAHGLVIFAHGSGSSRHSPRNRHVAHVLDEAGLGTLLFDLLTRTEDGDRRLVFDIDLLAGRLSAVTRWIREHGPGVDDRTPIGYFGASTGAAAALVAAATGQDVDAVVSRGGRPDLAADDLRKVRAPTLLIVGSLDTQVLALNEAAQARLTCPSRLEIVPGASHLFEEHGTLAVAADLARRWFIEHLVDERT